MTELGKRHRASPKAAAAGDRWRDSLRGKVFSA
jgi:hypothetical protein